MSCWTMLDTGIKIWLQRKWCWITWMASLTIDEFTRSHGFANHDTLGNPTWICQWSLSAQDSRKFCCEGIFSGILNVFLPLVHSEFMVWKDHLWFMFTLGVFQVGRKLQILGSLLLGLTIFLTSSSSFSNSYLVDPWWGGFWYPYINIYYIYN